ncbi:hypothetical protein Anapl_18106 [Anas platyrhynchos]|uniref:Uncharacterized protein n=1 Tax=Anas platyrhynchos TaxID=8839 RepID=R0JFD4_ANAPL|nr:hypothetical protein Anapl_18106 [Anas platyrhynchos]
MHSPEYGESISPQFCGPSVSAQISLGSGALMLQSEGEKLCALSLLKRSGDGMAMGGSGPVAARRTQAGSSRHHLHLVSGAQEVAKAEVQRCDESSPKALSSRLNMLLVHDNDPV